MPTALSGNIPRREGNYEYFPLCASGLSLLPEGQELVIDHMNGMATLVDWKCKTFLCACTLFDDELEILCPILRAWPAPVSYPLLAALADPKMGETLAQRVAQAIEAEDDEELESLLEPLQSNLDTLLERFQKFGLTILPMDRHGLVVNTFAKGVNDAK